MPASSPPRPSSSGVDPSSPAAGHPGRPGLVALDDSAATEVDLVGGKAAALSRAARAGLPTLPGVVVPVGSELAGDRAPASLVAEIRRRMGDGPLVARSSSPEEDTEASSMAGQFESVLDLRDDEALACAIATVARSGERVAEQDGLPEAPPVAVLVQPMVEARVGGVCFGAEPVTGRTDRRLVVASAAGPDAVVSGEVTGLRYVLDDDGGLLERTGEDDAGEEGVLDEERCRELVALVDRASEVFGGPQDVEFLVDSEGRLRLLQSRPVTTDLRGPPTGPAYGTGPVAETFPEPLGRLEQAMWVGPLREGLVAALGLSAIASERQLDERPVVVVVDGRVAVDLELVAGERQADSFWSRIQPAARARRARATWRVGRLRAALPALARDLIREADQALAAVGPLDDLTDRELVGLLMRSQVALRSLHGHEVLMGLLVESGAARLTGVSLALRALAAGRQEGLTDDEIIRRDPVVLALTGPRVDGVVLPATGGDLPPPLPAEASGDTATVLREALRLRVRWVQELMAGAARKLGRRLAERGVVPRWEAVVVLDLAELAELVAGGAVPIGDQPVLEELGEVRDGAPLPTRFRLDAEGRPVPEAGSGDEAGTGAGGGTARGPVVHDLDEVRPGSVLVVGDLRPDLAAALPDLGGLVAESGSPLAHLAILAREAGVPTVVGAQGVGDRFDDGAWVEVDGERGAVRQVEADR